MKFKSWIFKIWPMTKYESITLPWGIYFRQSREATSPKTINHEMVHVEQIARLGIFKFYSLYLYYYFKNILKFKNHDSAYFNIPFEIEAREKE